MISFTIFVAITGLTIFGDYCIKLASGQQNGLATSTFMLGLALYALPAFGWFFLMRSHSLAAIGVFYSASTIFLLAALGYFVFKEPFGLREITGVVLAIAAVAVISSHS